VHGRLHGPCQQSRPVNTGVINDTARGTYSFRLVLAMINLHIKFEMSGSSVVKIGQTGDAVSAVV